MKKMFITLLVIIGIITLILIGGYLYVRYMPDKSITKQAADFTLPASSLAIEYETNPTICNRKFIDRVILVEGVISEITTDQNNSTVFILRDNNSSTGILCTLNGQNEKKIKRYKKGDNITIKGICSGMLFDVVLNKCIIIEH